VIKRDQLLEAMKLLVDNPTISDMPIEDLRKWKAWDLTPLVLGYAKKESHCSIKLITRAITKFAIAAATADPKNKEAVEFVKAARERDAKQVEFLEDLMRDELKPTPPADKKAPMKTGG
jgi:hypothetical protein